MIEEEFLQISADRLLQSVERIETCVRQLTPEQVWARASENENAVGNLLLHLAGNVRQWILTGVGGAPLAQICLSAELFTASLRAALSRSLS